MAKKKKTSHVEVDALREEVKNLAGQVNTAVGRILELEREKQKAQPQQPPESEDRLPDLVQALRQEVRNMANALQKAVDRVRELEEARKK